MNLNNGSGYEPAPRNNQRAFALGIILKGMGKEKDVHRVSREWTGDGHYTCRTQLSLVRDGLWSLQTYFQIPNLPGFEGKVYFAAGVRDLSRFFAQQTGCGGA